MSAHLNKDNMIVMLGITVEDGLPLMIAIEQDPLTSQIVWQMKVRTKDPPVQILGLYSDVIEREQGPYYYYLATVQNRTFKCYGSEGCENV